MMRNSLPALSALVLAASLAGQGSAITDLPIRIAGEVDSGALAASGRAVLKLRFTSDAATGRVFAVRVVVRCGDVELQQRDHSPPVPTRQWQQGQVVAYDMPLVFATLPPGVAAGSKAEVQVGFLDPGSGKVLGGMQRVAGFELPEPKALDAAAVDAVIAAATQLAAKAPQDAWDQLEFAFRQLDDYPLKARLQKALLQVGKMPPRPLSFEEEDVVRERIRDERARCLRQQAGRMFDRGQFHAALLLLDEVGGALQEQADRAVLGALGDATRVAQDRDGVLEKIYALDDAQQVQLKALGEKFPKEKDRLDAALKLAKDPANRAVARETLRVLEYLPDTREPATAARAAIEKAWLADVPAEQRTAADAALQHPCWARTTRRASHRFVVIGPEGLVAGIPDDSLLKFDLAYLYLTDLFGRVPNPNGDRVTVYWKELWEFGGGVGGGKTIDIGNADANAKALRVDNGLLYHELTHCIDDTAPVYGGMHEGLADFGAAFVTQELGQIAAARAMFGLAARAFQLDYLERDLECWRIPNYGPSAGFLLHFIARYGKSGDGYEWQRYRKFFRDYRADRIKDARTPQLARAFAFHLMAAFGPDAFNDLQRFRWPLLDSDREAIAREQEARKNAAAAAQLGDFAGSPVPRDRVAAQLQREQGGVDEHHEALGVVRDWWVIGPFRRERIDADAFRFPPELEIDLQARYESILNNPTWRQPGSKPVTVDATGWVRFDYAYQDDAALYALTHVTVAAETAAWFHLRGDDDVTLFVDDALIGKYEFPQGPLGPWRPRGDVELPDAMAFPVTLSPGRHKVLLKIYNRGGGAGCTLAIAQRNGLPLPGWTTDLLPPVRKLAAIEMPDPKHWTARFKADFSGNGSQKKIEPAVGKWRSRQDALEGFANDRQVEWRKYTVRPGFPKDSPSNLAWLPERATEGLDSFQLVADLAPEGPPKLCLIVQGEGHADALSGWTLILEPIDDKVRARLERYDRLVYMSDVVPCPVDPKTGLRLELLYHRDRCTVRLGNAVLFDQAPLRPIPGRHRIGFATWGEQMRIAKVELRVPSRTK